VGAKFCCPHALADGNQRIQIKEKALEFCQTVLSILFPYLIIQQRQNKCNGNTRTAFKIVFSG